MSMFRKKPVVVEAFQYTGPEKITREQAVNPPPLPAGMKWDCYDMTFDYLPHVVTIHGQRTVVRPDDWIVTEPDGEHHYPVKPDIFAATYEPADPSSGSPSLSPEIAQRATGLLAEARRRLSGQTFCEQDAITPPKDMSNAVLISALAESVDDLLSHIQGRASK